MDLIKIAEQAFNNEKAASYPEFKAGDTITVTYRIKEGDKERLQKFRGVVIQISGMDPFTKTFTVRKIASGVGVEALRLTNTVKCVAHVSSTSVTSPVKRPASARKSTLLKNKEAA